MRLVTNELVERFPPGARGERISPPGDFFKVIFSSTSKLTLEQWMKIETAL